LEKLLFFIKCGSNTRKTSSQREVSLNNLIKSQMVSPTGSSGSYEYKGMIFYNSPSPTQKKEEEKEKFKLHDMVS